MANCTIDKIAEELFGSKFQSCSEQVVYFTLAGAVVIVILLLTVLLMSVVMCCTSRKQRTSRSRYVEVAIVCTV